MKRTVSRRVTGTVSTIIILTLVLGSVIYLRTASNASEIDNRNLRELARIGQGIEGRVNNLHTVLKSLASDMDFSNLRQRPEVQESLNTESAADTLKKVILESKTDLIPNLTAEIIRDTTDFDSGVKFPSSGQTAFKTDLADGSLQLWYNGKQDAINDDIHATYDFAALQATLSSDYMETVFLADQEKLVFLWESELSGFRIHELAALDTLHFKAESAVRGIGVSDIVQIPVAGQEYRFYLLPIRINLKEVNSDEAGPKADYTRWILGGMIPVSEYNQQTLALDPNIALKLGFLVIAGFLVVPFVRVFTMGPKERFRASHLLYLIIALIFGAGFTGLLLADFVHYHQLRNNISKQLAETADTVVRNLDHELQAALKQLNNLNQELVKITQNTEYGDTTYTVNTQTIDISSDKFLVNAMKDSIRPDEIIYPYFHMVFWADSVGNQIAKWTPRSYNTPRVDVSGREYFRTIKNDQAWKQKFHIDRYNNTCADTNSNLTDTLSYFTESIRSWTTGENLAAISIPWQYKDENNKVQKGISAITTELASLTRPVLPAGIELAVVDASARTLFHIRPERILDENFAEETSQENLLRSVLAARACKEVELTYGGRQKMAVVRPLTERPLFLILIKDLSLIDTVRFEAWFEGGALFGIWVILILILLFMLDRIATTRMGWLWPDLKRPGKYFALIIISFPFILLFIKHSMAHGHMHIHSATLLAPVIFLGLGLIVLSWGRWPNPRSRESNLGWLLVLLAVVTLVVLSIQIRPSPWAEILAAAVSLIFVTVWLRLSRIRNFLDRWSGDLSPRMMYTAAMVSGLLVVGVLPGYLTYLFAFHDHRDHMVRYHQLELADAMMGRHLRIDEIMQDGRDIAYRDRMKIETYDQAFEKLLYGTTTQSEAFEYTRTDEDHSPNMHEAMHDLLGARIPFLSEASINMRQLSEYQADRKWVYSEDQDLLQLQINDEEPITSRLPGAAGWLNFWRILLLFGVMAVLFLIVYRVNRLLFFSHLEHSDAQTLKNVLPKEIIRRWDRVLGRFTKVILSDDVTSTPFEASLKIQLIGKLTDDLNNLCAEMKKSLVKETEVRNKDREMEATVEMAVLKMEWLKEELDSLDNLLNPDEEHTKKKESWMPDTEWFKHRINKLFRGIRMWINTSVQVEAELKVQVDFFLYLFVFI